MTAPNRRTTVGRAFRGQAAEIGALNKGQIPNAQYEIKLFDDNTVDATSSPAFGFSIPADLNHCQLWTAEAFYTLAGGATCELMVYSDALGDLLNTPLTIGSGNRHSSWPADIILMGNGIQWRDEIFIDVVSAGGGRGLGIILKFVFSSASF